MCFYSVQSFLFTLLHTVYFIYFICIAAQNGSASIQSFLALHYWQYDHILTIVQDLHSIVPLSPHQISTNALNHHAPLQNPWPLFWEKKRKLTWEMRHLSPRAGCLEPRLALATPPLVLMCNHHSPLQMFHYSLGADTILRPIWGCTPQVCSLKGKVKHDKLK